MAKVISFDDKFVEMVEDPCPFCGSHDTGKIWHSRTLFGPILFYVMCHVCRARGPERENPGEAVMDWNRRK